MGQSSAKTINYNCDKTIIPNRRLFKLISQHETSQNLEMIVEYINNHPETLESTRIINDYTYTPLILALFCSLEIVNILLDGGADINRSILMIPGKGPTTALNIAIQHSNWNGVQLLLDRGADINGNYGDNYDFNYTPLMVAVNFSDSDLIQYLLKRGADPNIIRNGNRLLGQKWTVYDLIQRNGSNIQL